MSLELPLVLSLELPLGLTLERMLPLEPELRLDLNVPFPLEMERMLVLKIPLEGPLELPLELLLALPLELALADIEATGFVALETMASASAATDGRLVSRFCGFGGGGRYQVVVATGLEVKAGGFVFLGAVTQVFAAVDAEVNCV